MAEEVLSHVQHLPWWAMAEKPKDWLELELLQGAVLDQLWDGTESLAETERSATPSEESSPMRTSELGDSSNCFGRSSFPGPFPPPKCVIHTMKLKRKTERKGLLHSAAVAVERSDENLGLKHRRRLLALSDALAAAPFVP